MNDKVKVFLIGASGFIGNSIKNELLLNNFEVFATYNNTKINDTRVKSFKKNLMSESLYSELVKLNPDVVIHCAGLNPSVLLPENDDFFYRFNRDATLELAHDFLKFCQAKKSKHKRKFINLSTYEVYGNINRLKGFDEFSKTSPLNAYADSKAQALKKIEEFDGEHATFINVVCTNNFGPRQSKDKLIPAVFENLLNDEQIYVHGDGSSQRTWTYVKDTSDGILKVIKYGKDKRYHISSSDHISVIGVINSIHDIMKSKNLILTNSAKISWCQANDNPVFKINSTWTQEQLNWKTRTLFSDGLSATIDLLSN